MTTADPTLPDALGSTQTSAFRQALPAGTQLDGGKYVLERILGEPGGFGVTYLARDVALDLQVAIKEYLPRELAARGRDGLQVEPDSPVSAESFQFGLEAFVDEARRLARFEHPNIVGVRAFFRQHGTAYMVMQYYQGRTLDAYLEEEGGQVSQARALELILPVLDALGAVHAEHMIHRDIKPQNIYLTDEDRPILLDFGAARVTLSARSDNPTRLFTRGFAAPEQYLSNPSQEGERQGTWTDVYGVAATLFRMTTGRQPPDALDRLSQESLPPLASLAPRLSRSFRETLEKGLAVSAQQRPRDAQTFRRLLSNAAHRSSPPDGSSSGTWAETPVLRRSASPPVARELRPRQRKGKIPPRSDRDAHASGEVARVELPISGPALDEDDTPHLDTWSFDSTAADAVAFDTDTSNASTSSSAPSSRGPASPDLSETDRSGTHRTRTISSTKNQLKSQSKNQPKNQSKSRWRRWAMIGVLLVLAIVGGSFAYDHWMPRPPGLYLKVRVLHVGANERLRPDMVHIVQGEDGPPEGADLVPELDQVCTIIDFWGGQRIQLDELTFQCP